MAAKGKKRQRSPTTEVPEPASIAGPARDLYGVRETDVEQFSTGSTILDCVLSGGYALNRVINIVGDSSSGKTLLAIEACTNFALHHNRKCEIRYRDIEEAFDEAYAHTVGLPQNLVDFKVRLPPIKKKKKKSQDDEDEPPVKESASPLARVALETVEDLTDEIEQIVLEREKPGKHLPLLYIVDSLDALSDRAEQARMSGEATFGAGKGKAMSEFFRKWNGRMARAGITLLIISQLRDAIGVTFGEKQKPSGGRALRFYSYQQVWLHHIGQIKKTKNGVERVVGVNIRAKCKKSKAGPAFREGTFPIMFNYGIEDLLSCLNWLVEVERTDAIGLNSSQASALAGKLDRLTQEEYEQEKANITGAVREVWSSIEEDFAPKRRKYT